MNIGAWNALCLFLLLPRQVVCLPGFTFNRYSRKILAMWNIRTNFAVKFTVQYPLSVGNIFYLCGVVR